MNTTIHNNKSKTQAPMKYSKGFKSSTNQLLAPQNWRSEVSSAELSATTTEIPLRAEELKAFFTEYFTKLGDPKLIESISIDMITSEAKFSDYKRILQSLNSNSKLTLALLKTVNRDCEDDVVKIVSMLPYIGSIFNKFEKYEDLISQKKIFADKTGDLTYLLNFFNQYLDKKKKSELTSFEKNHNVRSKGMLSAYREFTNLKDNMKILREIFKAPNKFEGKLKHFYKTKPDSLLEEFHSEHQEALEIFFQVYGNSQILHVGNSSHHYTFTKVSKPFSLAPDSTLNLINERYARLILIEIPLEKFTLKIYSPVHRDWLSEEEKLINDDILLRYSKAKLAMSLEDSNKSVLKLPAVLIKPVIKSFDSPDEKIFISGVNNLITIEASPKKKEELATEIKEFSSALKEEMLLETIEFLYGTNLAIVGQGAKVSDLICTGESRAFIIRSDPPIDPKDLKDAIKGINFVSKIIRKGELSIKTNTVADNLNLIKAIQTLYPDCNVTSIEPDKNLAQNKLELSLRWSVGTSKNLAQIKLKDGSIYEKTNISPKGFQEIGVIQSLSYEEYSNLEQLIVFREPSMDMPSIEQDREFIMNNVISKFKSFVPIKKVEITENEQSLVREAVFQVDNFGEFKALRELIELETLFWHPVQIIEPSTCSLMIPKAALAIIRAQVERTIQEIKKVARRKGMIANVDCEEDLDLKRIKPFESTDIKIFSQSKEDLITFKQMLEDTCKPEVIKLSSYHFKQVNSEENLKAFLKFARQNVVFAFKDASESAFKLWGERSKTEMLRGIIKQFTEQESFSYEIELKKPLLQFQLRALRIQSRKFKDSVIEVDEISKKITIISSKNDFKNETFKIEKILAVSASSSSFNSYGKGCACNLCQDKMTSPYTLLTCEHTFCKDCVLDLLDNYLCCPENLPVRCPECSAMISLEDIRFLKGQAYLEKIIDFSVKQFLNASAFENCPGKDCKQVFRRFGKIINCPCCRESFCSKCMSCSHGSLTCQQAKLTLSRSLMEQLGIKKCGKCQKPIQKSDGCNHVSCNCGNHICWLCVESFEKADDCYSHLSSVHGGYFDH